MPAHALGCDAECAGGVRVALGLHRVHKLAGQRDLTVAIRGAENKRVGPINIVKPVCRHRREFVKRAARRVASHGHAARRREGEEDEQLGAARPADQAAATRRPLVQQRAVVVIDADEAWDDEGDHVAGDVGADCVRRLGAIPRAAELVGGGEGEQQAEQESDDECQHGCAVVSLPACPRAVHIIAPRRAAGGIYVQ